MFETTDLKRIPILGHMGDSDLVTLGLVAEEKEFPAGATIFVEASEGNALFIIVSGDVQISKATHSGEAKVIATLGPSAFFGEMALFDDFVRSATASALTAVRTLEISKDAFMKFLTRDAASASRMMLEIVRTMAPRMRQTNRELVALYEAGRIIGDRAESGQILSSLLGVLSDATSCTRGSAFLLNATGDMLECRAAFGYEADPSGWSEPLAGGIAEEIIQAANAISIENFQKDPRFQSLPAVGYETPSILGAALRAQGRAIGMILLCDKTDDKGRPVQFTPGDANLLAGVAAQASGAVESARLHEEAQEKEKLDRVYFRF